MNLHFQPQKWMLLFQKCDLLQYCHVCGHTIRVNNFLGLLGTKHWTLVLRKCKEEWRITWLKGQQAEDLAPQIAQPKETTYRPSWKAVTCFDVLLITSAFCGYKVVMKGSLSPAPADHPSLLLWCAWQETSTVCIFTALWKLICAIRQVWHIRSSFLNIAANITWALVIHALYNFALSIFPPHECVHTGSWSML